MAQFRGRLMHVVVLLLAARFADTFSKVLQLPLSQLSAESENTGLLSQTDSGQVVPPYRVIDPIIYLRIPESGVGFATTIVHHACGGYVPDDASVDEPAEFTVKWASVCSSSRFGRFQSGHDPLPPLSDVDRSHVVVMIRDPAQRVISGYYNDFHDCEGLQRKYNCALDHSVGNLRCDGDIEQVDGRYIRNPEVASPLEYGMCVENCATNMLTGRRCEDSGSVDVDRAIEIIGQLGFVGLSDEWALSVCLWHRKFGGRALPVEFAKGRPGATSTSGVAPRYNTGSLLGEWRPEADTQVFLAASRRFWQEIHELGIDEAACEREAAELFATSLDIDNTGQPRTDDLSSSAFSSPSPTYHSDRDLSANAPSVLGAPMAASPNYIDPVNAQSTQGQQVDGVQANVPTFPAFPNEINPLSSGFDQHSPLEINPIRYLQIPYSGSGFATVVAHHACGAALPDDEVVDEPSEFVRKWGAKCSSSRFARFESGQDPVSTIDIADAQHVVVMFRDPAQRVLSAYHDDLHDCFDLQRRYNCEEVSGRFRCDGDVLAQNGNYERDTERISPIEYGQCVENCTVNMLTGRSCGASGMVDIDRAMKLVNNLGFVGLSEEWALSVCLWHKRFGGRMLPAELRNAKRDVGNLYARKYDAQELFGHWRPEADYQIFFAARSRFWKEVEDFGVNPEECEREAADMIRSAFVTDSIEPGSSFKEPFFPQKAREDDYSGSVPFVQNDRFAATNFPADSYPVQSESTGGVLTSINPIHYLHLPQTGSGFATVVAHHACGLVLPDEETVEEPSEFLQKWGRTCDQSRFGRFVSGHDPLSVTTTADMQHVVVMLREPVQRTLSGYYHGLSDCYAIVRKYNCKTVFGKMKCDGDIETKDGHFERDQDLISPLEYANCVENCTANMLTGRSCDYSGLADVDRAVQVVDEVGFVGLTEEWALSVCLWHKRFGGRMLPSELKRMKSTFQGSPEDGVTKYNGHVLGRWQPEAEYAVFDAATRRFWREIEQFGVDPEACQQEAKALVHAAPASSLSTFPVATSFDN